MASALPTGGEISTALVREHLYTFDKEAFVDKLSTASQNGCAAAYSTRLLRSNYFGPMVRVRRSSDNAEQDFYGDVFGKLGTRIYGTGTSFTSWLGGATGYVRMMYDQSGNVRNIGQATNANQPTISTTAITYSGSQWLDVTNTQLPTAAMTSNSSGGLVASASSINSAARDAFTAFDLNNLTGWHSGGSRYSLLSGRYSSSTTTTDINNVGHLGEWIQLQLASAIKLNSFRITPRTFEEVCQPRDFVILGSNNGTTWNVVHQEFDINWTSAARLFTVNTSNVQSYSYYRLIVKRVGIYDSIVMNGISNILTNGNFSGGSHITEYNAAGSYGTRDIIALSNPTSSGYVLRMTGNGEYELYLTTQLAANTTYVLSGWYATSSDYNGVNTMFHARAHSSSGAHNELGNGIYNVIDSRIVDGLTWRFCYATLTTPADYTYFAWFLGYGDNNTTGYRYYAGLKICQGILPDATRIMELALNPTTVPLAAGDDTYTYYTTWTPTSNTLYGNICEQNTSSINGNRRAGILLYINSLKYGFCGEGNDVAMVAFALNIKRRTVMMCNHNLTTGNVEIYDEGVLYKATSSGSNGGPANLNVGGDVFSIGRCATKSDEFFVGQINEVIVTSNTALEREALLYFAPTLLTKPRELYPKPKKALTFFPVTDNPTPTNHGSIAIANLNLDLINVSHGTAVSDWNGYAQATSGNRPVYNSRGGYTNEMGYVNFDRTNSQHLTGGSRTFNIATNGGFTAVALVKFTTDGSSGSYERIFDFHNAGPSDNLIMGRSGTSSSIFCSIFNGSTNVTATGNNNLVAATGTIVQNEWAVFAMRYTYSSNLCELIKNGIVLTTSTTLASLTNRTLANTYIGRSAWGGDAYTSMQLGGLYIFDKYLSTNEMVALSNSLTVYALPNIPRHISDNTNSDVGSLVSIPSRTGWSGAFNGTSGNYIDMMDVPNLPMSYCFWFYQTSSTYATIVGLCDFSRNGNGIQIDYPTATNRLTVFSALPATWSTINIENVLVNTWYHVCVTVNTNFQVQVYLNGAYQNQVTGTAIVPARSRFVIGASGDGGRGYQGYIQDFRVYDYILRSDDITKLYDGISLNQNSLQVASNYLVNRRNWYSIMQVGKATGGSFGGAYVAQQTGTDPNVQYQLLNSTQNVQNYLYHYQRIQDYRSFTCSFEINITSGATGDQMYFFVGASSFPVYDNIHNNSNSVGFQVYNLNGSARPGVNFWRLGSNVSQSDYTQYIGASRWVPVTITYQRSTSDAVWVINVAGNDVINYIDTNNETWRVASGNYWGIGAWDIGAVMTCYVRRVELTYVPDASGQFVKGLLANSPKRYPESALTANSSLNCVASASSTYSSGFHPAYKAFDYSAAASVDNSGSTMYHSAWSLYNTTTGAYTGSTSTIISGTTYSGEWLQIQLPYAISLTDYSISCRPDYETTQAPNTWIIGGSTNGTTWVLLDSESNISNWASTLRTQNFKVSNTSNRYTYFRIVCTVTGQASGSDRAAFVVSEWQLNGYRQFGTKYPIAPMTSDTTTISGNALGCGTYRTTYSSTWADNTLQGWRAFTGEANDCFHISNDGTGAGSGGGLYRGANGSYTGAVTTTISGSSYAGEWLQIELPHPIRLTRYSLLSRNGLPNQSAKTWKIAGSNDSSTWTEVDTETNIIGWADNVAKTFTSTNSTVAYKYYRMVTNQIQDPADWHWAQREWMLYDDTTNIINLYNKTPGLVEGFTWKLYDGWISSVNLDNLNYYNVGRCTNTTDINRILNGEFITAGGAHVNYATEICGYFRANVTGTWSFRLWGNDVGYFWIGANALSGFTTSNANMSANLATGTTTAYLVEGVYYPIRIRHSQQTGFNDLQFYFTPPSGTETSDGTGYFFSSTGSNQAYPAESARIIKEITQTNTDGVYYINVNGISTAVHCLMNDHYDGGGWMMLMKATRGTTFNYYSNYWTTQNTLNSTDTTRNDADAKFNTFNYSPIKDIMAIWPDISPTSYTNVYSKNGGSLLIDDGWVWKIDNWNHYAPPLDQLSTAGRSASKGAYALSRLSMSYTGPTIKIRRSSDNVEQDFYANIAGNMGTLLDAGGTAYDSWIGNIFNPTNWYTLMTAGGTAQAVAGSNPYVQSQVATGGSGTSGYWSSSNVTISGYNSLYFSGEVYWQATAGYGAGDLYSVNFGDTTAAGGQGISILFMFWSGYTNNGFSGTGIYLLKNGVALAKSSTSPVGTGTDTWFPISIIYNKSTTNTWQVTINGVAALTYSDANVVTWAASAGTYFSINASSGLGLRMSVWYRRIYLASNVAYVTTWYDQSGTGNHATQTTTTAQPMYIQHYGFIDFYNDSARFLNIPSGTFTTGVLNAPFSVATRHGLIQNTANGGFYGAGAAATNQANALRMNGTGAGTSYNHYFYANDYAYGTYGNGNYVSIKYDGATKVGYVNNLIPSGTNTVNGATVAAGQQYIGKATANEYLNGQIYFMYIFNISITDADLVVCNNTTNYLLGTNLGSTRQTALAGFQISRDVHPSNPYVFNGFSTTLFSRQTGNYRHIMGGGSHLGLTGAHYTRWGLVFNNESWEWGSADTSCGVGLSPGNYSAGDYPTWGGVDSVGINRTARVELYGR
jgi:hypothetical protein